MQITDQLNSANSQTCTYGYDDLVRLTSATCGSAWSQTFGYDPFGNITKNGNASFNLLYDTGTNRIAANQGFTYDANGNTTQIDLLPVIRTPTSMISDEGKLLKRSNHLNEHLWLCFGP